MRNVSKFWTVGTVTVAIAASAVFLAVQVRSPAANALGANAGTPTTASEVATFAERFGAVWVD